MKNKDKVADVAIDAGYITIAEAARLTNKTHQSVRERAIRRGVNVKERRQARVVKTMAEIGKLLNTKGE